MSLQNIYHDSVLLPADQTPRHAAQIVDLDAITAESKSVTATLGFGSIRSADFEEVENDPDQTEVVDEHPVDTESDENPPGSGSIRSSSSEEVEPEPCSNGAVDEHPINVEIEGNPRGIGSIGSVESSGPEEVEPEPCPTEVVDEHPVDTESDENPPGSRNIGSSGDTSDDSNSFPIDALDGSLIGAMAREITRVAEVPPSVAVACVLGVASGSIGGGLKVTTYRGETRANLFILVVAKSGTGKDRALNLAIRPLNAIEDARLQHWENVEKPDLEASLRENKVQISNVEKAMKSRRGADLADLLRDLERDRAEIEQRLRAEPCLLVGDGTKEALCRIMENQPGEALFAVCAEARGILHVIGGRYSDSSDEDFYLAGYSGSRMKFSRVGRKTVKLAHPCLATLFMVQPDALRHFASKPEMVESGLLPRFLAFDARAEPQVVPDEMPTLDPDVDRRWRERIVSLVETYRDFEESRTVVMEADALHYLRRYANEIAVQSRTGGDLADVSEFSARWGENACRVALVLHAVEHGGEAHSHPLTLEIAHRAKRLVSWFVAAGLDLFGDVRETKRRQKEKRLVDLLENAPGQAKSLRDLRKSHGFDEETINKYAAEGWLKIERLQNPAGGRPSIVVRLIDTP
jgi:hypothetical protein